MNDEKLYCLSLLVEQDLHKRICAIREGNFPNENEMIQKTIESFEKSLPDYLKNLEGSHNFIIEKIREIDKERERIKQSRKMENKQIESKEQEK